MFLMLALIISFFYIIGQMQAQGLKTFLQIQKNSQFTLENIPFGAFSTRTQPDQIHVATRIGDYVIDLKEIENQGFFKGELFSKLGRKVFQDKTLNTFMGLNRSYWKQARATIQQLFSINSSEKQNKNIQIALHKLSQVDLHVPVLIGDYTDFYSSRSHAFNVGSIIRGPQNALNQNWFQIPIGYHGRSSSIVISGTQLRRPRGQVKNKDATQPTFSQCKRLDFQVEIGAFIGGETNQLGKSIKVNQAWNNVFGFVVLNDWSFRDFQTWEYVPLGPFTAKNGMSTISPWIVTLEALQGCEVALSVQQPTPLKYLQQIQHISYDINLQVSLQPSDSPIALPICHTNYKHMYWSITQQLTHHSISGCNMRPGDLLGSGTISGDTKQQYGSLLELTWGGRDQLLIGDYKRKFIQDGDQLNIRAYANNKGVRIGFGDCKGKVIKALHQDHYY